MIMSKIMETLEVFHVQGKEDLAFTFLKLYHFFENLTQSELTEFLELF